MRDFLPKALSKRRYVEAKVRECFHFFGYNEIETPVVESYDLIAAKSGNEIRHRLFAFTDLSGRKLALRPEITASVARIVTNKLRSQAKPIRIGYIANCFRYDNPQLGRYREFWQAGFEMFGSKNPIADAEILIVNTELMQRVGLSQAYLKIGHIGILKEILTEYGVIEKQQDAIIGLIDRGGKSEVMKVLTDLEVPPDGLEDIRNLFVLKSTQLQIFDQGRAILNKYASASKALDNLEEIVTLAQKGGATKNMVIDLGFARGLEYYTGMIFEVYVKDLGIALGGGGRYDNLVEVFGGASMSAVGYSPGIDRMVLALEQLKLFPVEGTTQKKILIIPVEQTIQVLSKTLEIASVLRAEGMITHHETMGRQIRSALSYAVRQGYTYAIIVGTKEIENNQITLRDLKMKKQQSITIDDLVYNLKLASYSNDL